MDLSGGLLAQTRFIGVRSEVSSAATLWRPSVTRRRSPYGANELSAPARGHTLRRARPSDVSQSIPPVVPPSYATREHAIGGGLTLGTSGGLPEPRPHCPGDSLGLGVATLALGELPQDSSHSASLPFVVGSHGRSQRLHPSRLPGHCGA